MNEAMKLATIQKSIAEDRAVRHRLTVRVTKQAVEIQKLTESNQDLTTKVAGYREWAEKLNAELKEMRDAIP